MKPYRVRHGYSQQEAADILGVKRVTVARWETKKQRPDVMTVRALLETIKK